MTSWTSSSDGARRAGAGAGAFAPAAGGPEDLVGQRLGSVSTACKLAEGKVDACKLAEGEATQATSETSSSSGPPTPPLLLGGRYIVKHEIGSGSYSDVYLGVDLRSGQNVALKLEWSRAVKSDKLLGEAELYAALGHRSGVPEVYWSGTEGEYNAMAMELLGPSLEDLRKSLGRKTAARRLSLKTVLLLADQMLGLIESIHECGVLHRDIKPQNFCIGIGDQSSRVYVVDFGLAKAYRDPKTGDHIPLVVRKGLTGTVKYTSTNIHDGLEAARRDDLIALGFVFMHWLRGDLPWQKLKADTKKEKHELIRQAKVATSDEELCRGHPCEFVEYFHYCRTLKFTDRPDYDRVRRLFRCVFAREGYEHDDEYDWVTGDKPPKLPNTVRSQSTNGGDENASVAVSRFTPGAAGLRMESEGGRGPARRLLSSLARIVTQRKDR